MAPGVALGSQEDGLCCTFHFPKAEGEICQSWYVDVAAQAIFLSRLELLLLLLNAASENWNMGNGKTLWNSF